MYVGWSMKTNLITISPDTSIFKAREMMIEHKISHLPVTDGKAHLLGILTDRDLKQAWASPATTLSVHELTYVLQKLIAANVMTKNVITGSPDMTIERAARIMFDNKIGALPIVKDNKLVGLITTSDLTEILLTALGMSDDSRRLSLLIKDRIGVLAEVGKCMARAAINIRSVLFVPLRGHPDYWQLILRVNLTNFQQATQVLEDAGFKVLVDYQEDPGPYLES